MIAIHGPSKQTVCLLNMTNSRGHVYKVWDMPRLCSCKTKAI